MYTNKLQIYQKKKLHVHTDAHTIYDTFMPSIEIEILLS